MSVLTFCLLFVQRAEHLKEIRNLAKKAVAKRVTKRVAKYKKKLRENLPSQIKIWDAREQRLLQVITGMAGVPVDALLVRECPDPPVEVDPDTDEEETKTDHAETTNNNDLPKGKCTHEDPTTQPWTCKHRGMSLVVCYLS